MAGPAPHPPAVPAAARGAVAAALAAPTNPVKLLVSGGLGTGKSSALAAIRAALRTAGVSVLTRVPRGGESAAVVIDDAHLLTDDELGELAEWASDPASTVVIAAEPLTHHRALRTLATALERENPAVSLRAFTVAEISHLVAETPLSTTSLDVTPAVAAATAGLPFLVGPALAAAVSADGPDAVTAAAEAARFALIERLGRLDESLLDTLLITSLSLDLGPDDVAAALRVSAEKAQALVDRSRATGLIEPSHSPGFVRMVHRSVAQRLGAARHHDTEMSLLLSQIEMSTLSTDLAIRMAEHGLRDHRLASALVDLASGHRGREAARAARLYRAAVDAGATALGTRLADALALTGDCTTAGGLADELLASGDPAERAAAVRIAASVAMHDGSATQAAELFGWLGPYPDDFVAAAGAIASLAAGDLAAARVASNVESAGPPTSTARAARSLADGLLWTVDHPFPDAIARLGQSIGSELHQPFVMPDTPASLVTLAALHGGDAVRARSVITRAVRAGAVEETFVVHRQRLLLGWAHMQDGQLTAASAAVNAVGDAVGDAHLHRRDALWWAALQTAIARRSGDSGAVQRHWYAAVDVLAEYSIDLFSLLPLGELWIAAARMHQVDRIQHTLAEAFALLDSLGNPVLWSMPLHWAGVHAGILSNSPDAVAPHGQALTAAAAHSPFARALADAGRAWLRVLARQVDADDIAAAARALSRFGLTSDATRLASQAALQTPDGRVSAAMLQLARDLKQTVTLDEPPAAGQPAYAETSRGGGARPVSSQLSEREREVAELLLLGMPYRDIGSRLFISAKTVEHHVARIRRRLGAESRSEMLSMLRAMLTPQA